MSALHILSQHLLDSLDRDIAGLALGMTFGIKGLISRTLTQQMQIAGITHMMVLSGGNITMFMEFVDTLLLNIPRNIKYIVSIFVVCVFISIIPLQPSVTRAAIMSFIPRIGSLMGKKVNSMYLLLFSCALILIFDISYLYNISFQLSFLAIFGITVFYRNMESEYFKGSIVHRVTNALYSQLRMGISAQVFTIPLVFYYFGSISLFGTVSTVIIAPFVSPIMFLTFLAVGLYYITNNLMYIPIFLLTIMVKVVIFITEKISLLDFIYIQY